MSIAAANKRYEAVAVRYGCRAGLARLIIASCRKWNLPISVGFALFQTESDFTNVFGHDPTTSIPKSWMGKPVTRVRYRSYLKKRSTHGMQGVGCGQLTWWETQDLADARGGCHTSKANIDVAVQTLAARIRQYGYVVGVQRYNGSGPAAVAYSKLVRARADIWHKRLA